MPFSVLRIWGLGLISWFLVGLSLYLGYEAYREFKVPDHPTVTRQIREDVSLDGIDSETVQAAPRPTVHEGIVASRGPWRKWALLTGAAFCWTFTFVGFAPIRLFLGGSTDTRSAKSPEPINRLSIVRPDGAQLQVAVYGKPEGPTLVLTHGWSLDGSAWDYIRADLGKHFRLVIWELPGMGKSTGPNNGDFSLERMARDLEAVLQATCAGTPVILFGHSIGGMVSQTFCRLHGKQLGVWIKGLVLLHTTYTNPLRTNMAATVTTAIESAVIVPLNYLTVYLAPIAWLSNWQSYMNGSLHIFTRFASFSGKQTREHVEHGALLAAAAWPAAVARGNLGMLNFNEEATLPQIDVPVLVIGGQHDRMTLESASKHIQALLPNDRPFSIDGGHLGHWEQAGQVSEVVREFASKTFSESARVRRLPQPAAE